MTSTAPHAAPPAPAPTAAIETAQELDAVARALFTLLLPGAVSTAVPQPHEPVRQEAPTAASAPVPLPSAAEHTAVPVLAPIALSAAPTAETSGVESPSSQPAALPLPAPVTIEVPPLDDAGQSQWPRTAPQHPAPRTMAMLTEIGFLDD